MEIHKPKAAHSWREFLTEIGTIICGILIALGIEQGIEFLHRDHTLHETRDAIREEIADNAGRADLEAREDRCLIGALDVLELGAHAGHVVMGGDMVNPNFVTTIWDASQLGAVGYMPLKEKFRYAHFYESARNMQTFVSIQRAQATNLSRMIQLGALNAAEARGFLQTLSEARTILSIKIVNERALVRQARAEGAIRRHDAAALQRLYDNQAPFNPRNWRSTAWQAIMSTQIADHMEKERLARYSFLFPGFEDLRLMLPPMIDARAEVLSGRLGGGWDVGSERAQLATAEKLRSQLKLYATIAWTENRIAKEAPKYPPWLRPSSISKGLADCQAAASWAEVRR